MAASNMLHAASDEVQIDARTIAKYKHTYEMPADAAVTADMVKHHWVLSAT